MTRLRHAVASDQRVETIDQAIRRIRGAAAVNAGLARFEQWRSCFDQAAPARRDCTLDEPQQAPGLASLDLA
jgi:hypothetical protein